MKHLLMLVIAIAMLTAQACVTETENKSQTTTATHTQVVEKTVPNIEVGTTQFFAVVDHSVSAMEYNLPDPTLFKELCDKISKTCTLDFRYGVIRDNSNTTLDRYYVLYIPPAPKQKEVNPWEAGEEVIQEPEPQKPTGTDWHQFVASVQAKLSAPPSKSSDIGSAIRHALVAFNENQDSHTRKILFLSTDFEDSYGNLPAIPSDIELITVGVLPPGKSVSDLLQYNGTVRTFENPNAAINYLLSLNFKNK